MQTGLEYYCQVWLWNVGTLKTGEAFAIYFPGGFLDIVLGTRLTDHISNSKKHDFFFCPVI